MDPWIISEAHQRRNRFLAEALRWRRCRLAQSGRKRSLRTASADCAQFLSEVLAGLAGTLRNDEASHEETAAGV